MSSATKTRPTVDDRENLKKAIHLVRLVHTVFPRLMEEQQALRDLISRDNRASEGRVGLVIGQTRMGKTHFVEAVLEEYPRVPRGITEPNGDTADHVPVVIVSAKEASAKALVERIYKAIAGRDYSFVKGRNYRESDVTEEIGRVARACRTKLIAIDEAHQVIERKRATPEDVALIIKALVNHKVFSVLLIGTTEVERILRANDELAHRGPLRIQLVRFGRTQEDIEDWTTVMGHLDTHLAQEVFGRRSGLDDKIMAEALRLAADGIIGDAASFIEDAGVLALDEWIKKGAEPTYQPGVTWHHLEKAFAKTFFAEGRANPFEESARKAVQRGSTKPAEPNLETEAEGPATNLRGTKRSNEDDSQFRR